jgi:hypothetical protein
VISIADVFREAGERHIAAGAKHLAAFIESLPTEEDRSRFLDAARAFLSFDPELGRLPTGRRRDLLHANGSDLATALWQVAKRLLDEDPPSKNSGLDSDIQLFGARLLMARLIIGGLRGASDKSALINAALALRELSNDAQAIRSKSAGETARREALEENSAERTRLVARLKAEAESLLKTTRLRFKRDRARHLNKRMGADAWSTADALVEFARRNGIKI